MPTGLSATFFAPVIAGVVSLLTMLYLRRIRSLPLDHPNERSLHTTPVPRTGGIAIVAGIALAAALLEADLAILAPAGVLAIASYADDRHALPVFARLMLHLSAAGSFLWLSGVTDRYALIGLALAIGWLINLYNFMDGADGLAGGMAVIGFAMLAIASGLDAATPLALLSLSVAAAAAGFLVFNFPPAKIFMGDVGSVPLGFLAGTIGIAGWRQGLWPLWFPLLVFAPFVVDATMTLTRRILQRERFWQAHRQHYYQRLILSGWSHRRTALVEYAAMLVSGSIALICLRAPASVGIFAFAIFVIAILSAMWTVDRRWRRFTERQG